MFFKCNTMTKMFNGKIWNKFQSSTRAEFLLGYSHMIQENRIVVLSVLYKDKSIFIWRTKAVKLFYHEDDLISRKRSVFLLTFKLFSLVNRILNLKRILWTSLTRWFEKKSPKVKKCDSGIDYLWIQEKDIFTMTVQTKLWFSCVRSTAIHIYLF